MSESKGQIDRGQSVLPGEERRRSQRVMVRIPVTLYIKTAKETVSVHADTVAVNDQGAMLVCSRNFDADTQLEIENDRSRQRLGCRVTRAPRNTAEGFLIPVEFDASTPGYWHITFPPSNGKQGGF